MACRGIEVSASQRWRILTAMDIHLSKVRDWPNRIEAQFQAVRYFALDGTDHQSHKEPISMIRRYTVRRNRNAAEKALREIITRVNVA